MQALLSAVEEVSRLTRPVFAFTPLSHRKLFGLGPWDKYLQARERLETLLLAEVERRRQTGLRTDDVIFRLLDATYEDGESLSESGLLAELLTLMTAREFMPIGTPKPERLNIVIAPSGKAKLRVSRIS